MITNIAILATLISNVTVADVSITTNTGPVAARIIKHRNAPMPPLPVSKRKPGTILSRKILISPAPNHYVGSIVASRSNPGMLMKDADGVLRVMSVTASWPNTPVLHLPPIPLKTAKRTALVATVLTVPPPSLSCFYVQWDESNKIWFTDAMNLQNGQTYNLQCTLDGKKWVTIQSVTWASSDPGDYWRVGQTINGSPANGMARLYSPP